MKNETLKIIVSVIITILTIVIVALSVIAFKKEVKPVTTPIQETSYQKEMRGNFMEGCMEESTYKLCDCAFNNLVSEFGYDGVINMSLNYIKTDKIDDKYLNVVNSCVNE